MTDLIGLIEGPDGRPSCPWPGSDVLYHEYHAGEWGRPVLDDAGLFERIALEGFQAGLSWITILRKRAAFRTAFVGFNPAAVASFDEADVARLLDDAGIVRNEAKIRATIRNAERVFALADEFGSVAAFMADSYEPKTPPRRTLGDIPAVTDASEALSKALKARGWSFVGPTTMYALMQAVGLVNDHLIGCSVRDACDADRAAWRAMRSSQGA